MLKIYRPSEEETMRAARDALRRSVNREQGSCVPPLACCENIGPPPKGFQNPRYGTPAYAIAFRAGWITAEAEQGDRMAYQARRTRALQTCHRFALYERQRFDPPDESGAYVPELAARLEDDRNLTDGARRCARKLAELTYRQCREGRALDVTVTYLMRALGRCRRTVQRYLRLLEREGYIRADVVRGARSRLCVGLAVQLRGPLFARHHRERWPRKLRNPDATQESQNHRVKDSHKDGRRLVSRNQWALRCMDGVYRALMKTLPPPAIPA